jgi:hypothetical protein
MEERGRVEEETRHDINRRQCRAEQDGTAQEKGMSLLITCWVSKQSKEQSPIMKREQKRGEGETRIEGGRTTKRQCTYRYLGKAISEETNKRGKGGTMKMKTTRKRTKNGERRMERGAGAEQRKQ